MRFFIALAITISSNNLMAFDQLQMFNRIIEKNIAAENICENQANNRDPMDNYIVDHLKKMNSKDRSSFLIYKYEIAMYKCQVSNGYYPDHFMDSLYYLDGISKPLKSLIEKYKEISAKPNIIENIFNYENIDQKIKSPLINSNYFEKPFKLSKIARQLHE